MFSTPDYPKSNPRVWLAGYYTSLSPLDCRGSLSSVAIGKIGKTPVYRRQSTTPVSQYSHAADLAPIMDSERSATRCMALLHFGSPAPVSGMYKMSTKPYIARLIVCKITFLVHTRYIRGFNTYSQY